MTALHLQTDICGNPPMIACRPILPVGADLTLAHTRRSRHCTRCSLAPTRRSLACALCGVFLLTAASAAGQGLPGSSAADGQSLAEPQRRPRLLWVQPVIVLPLDASIGAQQREPAAAGEPLHRAAETVEPSMASVWCRIPAEQLDQLFAAAELDLHVAEPLLYRAPVQLGDDQGHLDRLIQAAGNSHVIRSGQRQVTLMFLPPAANGSAGTDNNQGPRQPPPAAAPASGRYRTQVVDGPSNSTCRLALVQLPAVANTQRDALLIATAISTAAALVERVTGHWQTVSEVDGSTRHIAPSLTGSQLILPRFRCLSGPAAETAILDEADDPYFQQLQAREIWALTTEPVSSADAAAYRAEARRRFRDATLAFTQREEAGLAAVVQRLDARWGDLYPLFAEQPWWFLKVRDDLCGGFPHTRGPCIILSQRWLELVVELAEDPESGMAQALETLLLHEKLHVLQRYYPRRFGRFYESAWNLEPAAVVDHPWLITHQILNPDALQLGWRLPLMSADGPRNYWIRTVLDPSAQPPRMGADFQMVAIPLEVSGGVWRVVEAAESNEPLRVPTSTLGGFQQQVGLDLRLDHPHEMLAYTLPSTMLQWDKAGLGRAWEDPDWMATRAEILRRHQLLPAQATLIRWAHSVLRQLDYPHLAAADGPIP